MLRFDEMLQKLKASGKYLNDPKTHLVLNKEQVGEALSINFEDAIDAYEDHLLVPALSFDNEIANKISKYQNAEMKPVEIIFRLQYDYNMKLPFSYRSYLFNDLKEIAEAYLGGKLDIDEVVETLQNHLVSAYIGIKGQKLVSAKALKQIELAEKLVEEDKVAAAALLTFILGEKKTYTYDKKEFATVEDLYAYVNEPHRFTKFVSKFDSDAYFVGWLYYVGKENLVNEWKELIKYFDDNEVKEENKETGIEIIEKEVEKEIPMAQRIANSEFNKWMDSDLVSKEYKKIMKQMNNEEKLEAFSDSLEFGTAGLRGIVGPGSNRMNIFTVRKAAYAFARWILKEDKECKEKGLVIGYDNRHMSKEFMEETSRVFMSLGIKTYTFAHTVPTPELCFAIQKLHAAGGVTITASHNPKEYNGFKAYNGKGSQLVPNDIDVLLMYYENIQDPLNFDAKFDGNNDLLNVLDEDMDKAYYENCLRARINKRLDPSNLKVIYTSEHGTGYRGVEYVMNKIGYKFREVKEQCVEDPNFTLTKSANPEMKEAFEMALDLSKKYPCDVMIATDPDADRVGVVIFDDKKQPVYLTGNKVGALLIDYIIKNHIKKGTLSKRRAYMFNTIVTDTFGADIAKANGVNVITTLTGFKYIGEQMSLLQKKDQFIFGYEESIGYIVLPETRDKDALQTIVLVCEMINYYKSKGKTLVDVLEDLYKEYGYRGEETVNVYLKGARGQKKIASIMEHIRKNPPKEIAGKKVVKFMDYNSNKNKDLPKTNALSFFLSGGSRVAVRPSGTEPKCKFYYTMVAKTKAEAEQLLHDAKEEFERLSK